MATLQNLLLVQAIRKVHKPTWNPDQYLLIETYDWVTLRPISNMRKPWLDVWDHAELSDYWIVTEDDTDTDWEAHPDQP